MQLYLQSVKILGPLKSFCFMYKNSINHGQNEIVYNKSIEQESHFGSQGNSFIKEFGFAKTSRRVSRPRIAAKIQCTCKSSPRLRRRSIVASILESWPSTW